MNWVKILPIHMITRTYSAFKFGFKGVPSRDCKVNGFDDRIRFNASKKINKCQVLPIFHFTCPVRGLFITSSQYGADEKKKKKSCPPLS